MSDPFGSPIIILGNKILKNACDYLFFRNIHKQRYKYPHRTHLQ